VLDRLRAVDALDDEVGLIEGPLDVALAHAAVVVWPEVRIDGAPLVEVLEAGVGGGADVEDGLALLELDRDRLDGGLRRLLGLRGNHRDRLALPAHVVDGEQRLVGWDAEALEVAVDVVRHVLVGDDRAHAGQRLGPARVDRADERAVVRRAQCLAPERAVDAHVVDVHGAARDVGEPVVAGEARADGLHAGLPAPTSPRTAAVAASTIFT
jgi:hypothetical protein